MDAELARKVEANLKDATERLKRGRDALHLAAQEAVVMGWRPNVNATDEEEWKQIQTKLEEAEKELRDTLLIIEHLKSKPERYPSPNDWLFSQEIEAWKRNHPLQEKL